jgi:hypothetical protein
LKTPRRNKVALAVRKTKVAERLANGRSPSEQLLALDARLGAGVGASRERTRLAKLIAGTAKVKSVKAEVTAPVASTTTFKPLKAAKVKKAKK